MYENWLAEKLKGPILSSITAKQYNKLLDKPFKSESFFLYIRSGTPPF